MSDDAQLAALIEATVPPALRAASAYHPPADPAPVKLDANESPWPLPAETRARLGRAVADAALSRYPDGTARRLRAAIARREGADPDALVLGVGSDEVIGVLMAALARPREGAAEATVLYPTPSFVMYPITARVHRLTPCGVPLGPDFALDVGAMEAALAARRPNLVFLATPNNPTGNALERASLQAVIDAAPDTLVVLDEAYAPFSDRRLGDWVERFSNVGALGTLSKVGLAGLRVGWARLRPALAHEVNKARPPYNLCAPAQEAARYLLEEEPDVLDATIAKIIEERARLWSALESIDGVVAHPSEANFVLVEVPDAAALHGALLSRGVQVRRFANDARLANALRLTVGTPEENDALLAALRAGL